jgi:membrane dipeptidase
MPIITEALLRRGYSEQDVKKIMGENFLRVFEKVWKT